MTKEQYALLHQIQAYLKCVKTDLRYLGKLPRFTQNIDWMLDELEQYIDLQKELDE
jgi:CHASE3 domain sensor protein